MNTFRHIKHDYLRSRASTYVTLSSPSSWCDISINLSTIEIFVLISWIPASKNFKNKQKATDWTHLKDWKH